MNFYYLDASAWIKRYYQELGTAWMQKFFAKNESKACASLGLIEVLSTLARKKKAQEINATFFEQKILEIDADWMQFIQIKLTDEVVEIAKGLAKELSLRGADAVHLASALVLQKRFAEENNRLTFVSSDLELNRAAESKGLVVLDPNKQKERDRSALKKKRKKKKIQK